MLHRSVIFVDSDGAIVKTGERSADSVGTPCLVGREMPQDNRVVAMVHAAPDGNPNPTDVSICLGRIEVSPGPLDPAALIALYPDFVTEPSAPANRGIPLGIAAWSGARRQGRVEARAAAMGVPFLLLGDGLLRAPPGLGRVPTVLSATVRA